MNQPTAEYLLRQARRNQMFSNAPMGMGQCPLKLAEVAIFPVRYALDESPSAKGSHQGPHALPAGWSRPPPALQTRSYTLRQLRDGWLYVWNSVDQTFHEYQIHGEHFTRHPWTDVQLHQDVRHNPGETHPYLLYPRRSQLRLAYSPVQWTWRLCELMRNSATAHSRWMRSLDLPGFCRTGEVAHGGLITELGNSVADILVYGATPPGFTSTLLPTTATEPGAPFKAAFEEALVRGRVPEQDTALFIALDDPLALIDDLTMNLTGRLLEQSRFESLHQYPVESAIAVQRLCGFDTEAFVPDALTDPVQRQACNDDLYALLKAQDEVECGKDLASADQVGLVTLGATSTVEAGMASFKARWGQLPDHLQWQQALEEWNAKRLWREDVRFDDVQQYLRQTTAEARRLREHGQRSERDLLTWLDQLGPGAEAVYHDTCDEGHASQLLETAHALYTVLGNGENGQQWLCAQARQPSTLFGMALFNFNAEVATLIRTVSHNFSTTGKLDYQGREGDGSSPVLTPASAAGETNLATRFSEIKAVLDLETLRNSKLYQAMSSTARQAMTTLIKVANHQAKEAWHGLSGMLLPAMKQQAGLILAVPQVLISSEISSATQLLFNPNYPRDYQAWLLEVEAVKNRINVAQRVLLRPGAAYDQRAARIALQAHEASLKNLFLSRPNQILAHASGHTRLAAGLVQINHWLADLGQSEVLAQLKLTGTYEHITRTKAWMNQNLGHALPALLVGLNAWNLHHSARQAQNDGRFSAQEWRVVGANAAYAGNAVAALWVGPAWSRAGGWLVSWVRKRSRWLR
ncbi:toxin VasX [Pseudomonas sp. P1.8]|uniref:toxin VasX n=1 Tax=Pseudomonas sp. P1.8 TaxID=1699310 RepID=UPI00069FEC69|nr:toxin VasX [Pseudomonas sp. P1.8]